MMLRKLANICKRVKLEHSVTPYTKIISKYLKCPNVRLDPIKPLEENIYRTPFDINDNKIFLIIPKQ